MACESEMLKGGLGDRELLEGGLGDREQRDQRRPWGPRFLMGLDPGAKAALGTAREKTFGP